jgi:probable addiction module antidote protein
MNKRKLRTFDAVQIEHYRKNPGELKGYVAVALEEYQKDGDEKAFLAALSVAAKVHGGFSKLSKATGLNRENLYRALSERSDPRLSTVMQVLSTLGLSLHIR